MTALGAASIGAVTVSIVVDRIIRDRPREAGSRLRFAVWAITLMAGTAVETALIAGLDALALFATAAAATGLARCAMSSVGSGLR